MIVLAAGASQRMGRPKPLLEFDQETCLSLVLGACFSSQATETILVVGADSEAVRAEAIRSARQRQASAFEIVVNPAQDRGQTSSVKTGLEAMSGNSDAFVIMPVDQPLVTSAEIDMLIQRFEMKPRGRTIFIATHDNRHGHPVLFADSHRLPILEMEDDDPLNDYVRIREGETEEVDMMNPGVTIEMNTPEQYRRVLALYRGAGRP